MAQTKVFVILLLLTCIGYDVSAQKAVNEYIKAQQNYLDQILSPQNYNKKIPPYDRSHALAVTVNMFVGSIEAVDDMKREFNVQTTFTMAWNDQRLNYFDKWAPTMSLSPDDAQIWIPDVFFENEVSGRVHNLLSPNSAVIISPTGDVIYNARLSLGLKCPMDLKLYPFDTQNCSIKFSTYTSTKDKILLMWRSVDPIVINSNIELPVFKLDGFTTGDCGGEASERSCLNADFTFKRQLSNYLVQVYIPCSMFIVLTWLTMWLHHQDTSGLTRIALQVLTILLLAAQIARFNETNPTVSYTKAIDIWTGMSLTFIMAAALESIFVNCIGKEPRNSQINEGPPKGVANFWRQLTAGGKVDVIMRTAYPIAFLVFVVMYFGCYLLCAQKGKEIGEPSP